MNSELLNWLALHRELAGVLVALIAFTESLLIVGLIMPGAALLFGVGTLIGTGTLGLLPTWLWASVGAVLGDWLSFWIGRRYGPALRGSWPLRDHPRLLEQAVAFFRRHGRKSVFFGRFVGPVRPILPAVAGMLHMRPRHFLTISGCASLLWAPVYLLPGMLVGASLGVASEIGTRLLVLILLVVGLVWLTLTTVRRGYRLIQPHAATLLDRALRWGLRHPMLGRISGALVDPQRPETGALVLLAAALVLTAWAFSGILLRLLHSAPPTPMDRAVFDTFRGLHTPWANYVMLVVTYVGSLPVTGTVTAVAAAWLAWQRRSLALAHWVAAVTFALVVPWLLNQALKIPAPAELMTTAGPFSFPSAHTTRAITVFGFLAVLSARDSPPAWRWSAYATAGLLAMAVAVSRLYLGAAWLSDVLGGLTLGLVWVSVLGIAQRRHDPAGGGGLQLSLAALAALLTVTPLYSLHVLPGDAARYNAPQPARPITRTAWENGAWRRLPVYRNDLRARHRHPLTVQWAGPVKTLRDHLLARGWRPAPSFSWSDALFWLNPYLEPATTPILPQVHDGRFERLILWRATPAGRLVLRLWSTDFAIPQYGQRILVGNVSALTLSHPAPLVTLPQTGPDFDAPLKDIATDLAGLRVREVKRVASRTPHRGNLWGGNVLLVQPPD